MKTTTTLLELISGALNLNGYDETYVNGRLSFFNPRTSYIKKALLYDYDVQTVFNQIVFFDEYLNDHRHDNEFKKLFINKFIGREIKQQTVEMFGASVTSTFLKHKHQLNFLYNNRDKLLSGGTSSKSTNTGDSTSLNKNSFIDLPQDQVDIDVSNQNQTMNYATNVSYSNNKTDNNGTYSSENQNYNMSSLNEITEYMDSILEDFERECFLFI